MMANTVNRKKESVIRSLAEFSIMVQDDVSTRSSGLVGFNHIPFVHVDVDFSVKYMLSMYFIVFFIIFIF